MGVTSIKL